MRPAIVVAALAVAAVSCSPATPDVTGDLAEAVANARSGDTIVAASGVHHGPIVIDQPLTIEAEPGAVLVGPDTEEPVLLITDTSDVTVTGLSVRGGSNGVELQQSTGVVLDAIDVTGSWWHGIFVDNAQVEITDCRVAELAGPYAQGIEIVNSDGRDASTVRGCTITGPFLEGIASHVSRVRVHDNEVTGSSERGIAIAEMSAGDVRGNVVSDVVGAAYYCGDRSWCRFIGNAAYEVAAAGIGFRSTEGHGIVITLQATAFVEGFSIAGIVGNTVLLFPGSFLNPRP